MSEQSIMVENVSLSFPKKKTVLQILKRNATSSFLALDNVSLSVKRGEALASSAETGVENQPCYESLRGFFHRIKEAAGQPEKSHC